MSSTNAFERFITACKTGDQVGARTHSTDKSWSVGGDSARRVFEQCAGVDMYIAQAGPVREHDDRAAVLAEIGTEQRQPIWFLLARVGDDWKVDGFASTWDVAGLYAYGRSERLPPFRQLPESPQATTWFQALESNSTLTAGPDGQGALTLFEDLRTNAVSMRLIRTVGIPSAHRYAAAVAFEQDDGMTQTLWALLEGGPSNPIRILGRSFAGSTAQVLQGIDLPWPPRDSGRDAPQYTADEAMGMFKDALNAAHNEQTEEMGEESALGGRMGQVLTDLFESLLDPDQRPARADSRSAEERLSTGIGDVMRDFMQSSELDGERTTDDVQINSEFIRENGANLVGSLVTALTGAIMPKDLSIPLPSNDEGKPKVRIDVADLLSGLFSTPEPETSTPSEDLDA
ncbi:MAG: hypothetical protein ACJATT_004851 [Myxococcota bacterium]